MVVATDKNNNSKLYTVYSNLSRRPIVEQEWHQFLAHHLPAYMIPYQFIYRDILPKTSSEKIDRALLIKSIEENKDSFVP